MNVIQSITALKASLQEALAQQDWEAMGELDRQCRALVAEAAVGDASGDPALREQLEELSRLYVVLQQAARTERDRVASELTRLNQSKQVNQAYRPLE
ncbi:flagellar protein FliT [Stutzerimonas nitrititolerans]|uniref:flagellar protein FliT n=1 Tax=Stutzerimonas nitrititolerans TaxID=2482751 RepID=UPI0015E327BB|nr:flagellar protein FliT [Stutzerimonas nitrititolerans]MBA1184903.1 flagellar protein FliT [Stutzerimonas stutzeri]